MLIKKIWLPLGSLGRNQAKLDYRGVTIHNTDNPRVGADAEGNVRYMIDNAHDMYNSWHYTVDDHEAIQSIPEDEEAMHTGSREGNHTTVGIEIAENADGNILFATNTAAWLASDILRRHGQTRAVWKENIFQHHDWTGKNCPAEIRRGNPYNWDTFVDRVNMFLRLPALTRVLRYNAASFMRGDDVRAAQRRLKELGYYGGNLDGIFGPQMQKAVRNFQMRKGLAADGIIGATTWAQLWT
jgi:N-acetyl-anhydromuramyl-L-alanine amidase AmpD